MRSYNRELPKAGENWKHFKGAVYTIIGMVIDANNNTSTEEEVLYVKESDMNKSSYPYYRRNIDEFMSEVDTQKYPNMSQKYRFEKISKRG